MGHWSIGTSVHLFPIKGISLLWLRPFCDSELIARDAMFLLYKCIVIVMCLQTILPPPSSIDAAYIIEIGRASQYCITDNVRGSAVSRRNLQVISHCGLGCNAIVHCELNASCSHDYSLMECSSTVVL
jgi:hypothetical protein